MADAPAVSVVMPVHNREVLVGRAIRSILDQNFEDFEFVIVDDGSTDGTANTIRQFADSRISLVSLPMNCGIAMARNFGLNLARGAFIATMDSDNVALPDRLGRQVEFLLAHPEIDILGTNAFHIENGARDSGVHHEGDDRIKARLLALDGSSLFHSTMMVRAEFLRRNGLRYPMVPVDEDHAFWIDAMVGGARFHVLQEHLLERHRHDGNFTAPGGPASSYQFPRKTPMRARVLGLFFPQLTHEEAAAIATWMEEGRKHSLIDVCMALAAIRKASTDAKSHWGESKPEVIRILSHHVTRAVQALSPQGSSGKTMPGSL